MVGGTRIERLGGKLRVVGEFAVGFVFSSSKKIFIAAALIADHHHHSTTPL